MEQRERERFFRNKLKEMMREKKACLKFACEYPTLTIDVFFDKDAYIIQANDLDADEFTARVVANIKSRFRVVDIALIPEPIEIDKEYHIRNNVLRIHVKEINEASKIIDYIFSELYTLKNYVPLTDPHEYKPPVPDIREAMKLVWKAD